MTGYGVFHSSMIFCLEPTDGIADMDIQVDETGQKNVVLTLYELTESEATMSQEFHGMDPDLLQRAMGVLVKRGKAQVFGQEDEQGVKFF
jgi:predicted ATP-dependent serine protease